MRNYIVAFQCDQNKPVSLPPFERVLAAMHRRSKHLKMNTLRTVVSHTAYFLLQYITLRFVHYPLLHTL